MKNLSQSTKRSIPEYVQPPQLEISYPDETILTDKWTGGFYFGVVIGFCIAMVLMKILMNT
ncbi:MULTISPECIES: hypothetical protein [unclassified Acinetobacter]|uniref:hypothetical protein n=1 Tax=unclassified Acinetobacter TaxID=196816 RepID=UPI001F4B916E|nr:MULTISPECIES: hypothetical protein [unclassified Acinetobacter]MCH7353277.1 hypothetical protein [Acinetobacter sp. NIPH 2023]MCH7360659.1 hypothetical protein [Acinetobacter sp. NIPH 2024]